GAGGGGVEQQGAGGANPARGAAWRSLCARPGGRARLRGHRPLRRADRAGSGARAPPPERGGWPGATGRAVAPAGSAARGQPMTRLVLVALLIGRIASASPTGASSAELSPEGSRAAPAGFSLAAADSVAALGQNTAPP